MNHPRGRHRQSEVDQFQVLAAVGQEEVSRADVAVDEAGRVDRGHGLGRLADETKAMRPSRHGSRPTSTEFRFGPFQKLHHNVLLPSVVRPYS